MSTDVRVLIESYYAAWSRQDPEAVMKFFSESSIFEDLAFAAKFEGMVQIRSFVDLTYAGAPDFRVVPSNIAVDGSKFAAEWVMTGTHSGDMPGLPATGKRFEVRAISMAQLEGSTIMRINDYWSPLDFQRSVGLIAG